MPCTLMARISARAMNSAARIMRIRPRCSRRRRCSFGRDSRNRMRMLGRNIVYLVGAWSCSCSDGPTSVLFVLFAFCSKSSAVRRLCLSGLSVGGRGSRRRDSYAMLCCAALSGWGWIEVRTAGRRVDRKTEGVRLCVEEEQFDSGAENWKLAGRWWWWWC